MKDGPALRAPGPRKRQKENIPQITERFFRVNPAKSKEVGGTGLGLAIVKHIVNQHRAEMSITSELNKGTRISLVFPISL